MDNLIHQIYATALDAKQWPKLLLSLTQILQSSENSDQESEVDQHIIKSHISQAIEINQKQSDSNDKRDLAETSLSLLPIALFALSNNDPSRMIKPLNHKAEILLPKLKLKLDQFFKKPFKEEQKNKKNIRSEHVIQDDQAYLFLELPVDQIGIQGISRVALVNLSNQYLFNDSKLYARWNFSRKEIAICKQLLEGESIQSISLKNSRSVHTIRSQVKSIFQKSQLHSQIDLIRYFYSYPMSVSTIKIPDEAELTSTLESFSFRLSDGRIMSWAEHGDRKGVPIVLCHTMHQCRLMRHPDETLAQKMKIRIITPDRPGYGVSETNKQGSVQDWSNDLSELMQHLKIDNFALLGIGLGTVFALKAAQTFGERILKTTCVNIPDFVLPTLNCNYSNIFRKAACKLAKHSPELLLKIIKLAGRDIFLKDPISILTRFYRCEGANDKKVLENEIFQRLLVRDFSESNKQGFGKALVNELHFLLNHKRIFEPGKITSQVVCWYKNNCQNPNPHQIEQFANEISDARLNPIDSEDDFIIYHEWQNYLYATAYSEPL